MLTYRLRIFLAVALSVAASSACGAQDLVLWRPPTPPPDALSVRRVVKLAYVEGKDADRFRHRLDLYVPKGKKDFPVIVLVHGGSWIIGDNRCFGLYSSVGEFLASRGIGVVMPNYRLSPMVKHPEHTKDLARAVAWTKAHIGEYGGRADQLFLLGHSAGGHMVALLATDEQYLKAVGLRTSDIKGVISVCGVYRIPAGDYEFVLGGAGPDGLRVDAMLPIRGKSKGALFCGPGIPMSLNLFGLAFGDDPQVRADASPLNHVKAGLPPFLLFSAEYDLPTLPAMAKEFQNALVAKGCTAELHKALERNHNSIIFQAVELDDPVAKHTVDFVQKLARAR
jgi:acetyl esterase/lipase